LHEVDRFDPAVSGEQRVQCTRQRNTVPCRWCAEAHSLTNRVNAGVGPSGCMSHRAAAKDAFENPLEFRLYRATCWLALPSDKAGAVVVQRGKEGPAHGPESSPFDYPDQAAQLLVMIDKSQLRGVHFSTSPPLLEATLPSLTMSDAPLRSALQQLALGSSLTRAQSAAAFGVVMQGGATPAQAGALLMGLRSKGETGDEVAGAAQALRSEMVRLEIEDPDGLVDTCGTGGGRVRTVNISTAAAFIVAGAGVPVAKHGNRSYTSKCGSADVLEALGVDIGLDPKEAATVLRTHGFVFLFAPTYHPAMRHLASVRKELGVATIMNLLGPLVNPAGVRRQVVGVADVARAPLVAEALAALGTIHALVLHATVGMDEVSPVGSTCMWEVHEGKARRWELNPEQYGLGSEDLTGLAGGEPSENAESIERLLNGEGAPALRCAVLLNAAAALYVAGRGWSFEEAIRQAQRSLESGRAAGVLERVRAATPRF
jgi:anthranilate phosphoribosyltransferase